MPRKPKPVALDSEQIRILAEWGNTDEDIAKLARISERTLQNRFSKELAFGRATLRQKIRVAQLKLALEHLNPTMLIWAGKQYLRQRDIAPLRLDENELEQKIHNVVIELTDVSNSKQISTTSETDNN